MSQNQKKNESFIQWFLVIPYVWIFNHFSKSITWSKHKPSQMTESQHELFLWWSVYPVQIHRIHKWRTRAKKLVPRHETRWFRKGIFKFLWLETF